MKTTLKIIAGALMMIIIIIPTFPFYLLSCIWEWKWITFKKESYIEYVGNLTSLVLNIDTDD